MEAEVIYRFNLDALDFIGIPGDPQGLRALSARGAHQPNTAALRRTPSERCPLEPRGAGNQGVQVAENRANDRPSSRILSEISRERGCFRDAWPRALHIAAIPQLSRPFYVL